MKAWQILIAPCFLLAWVLLTQPAKADQQEPDTLAAKTFEGTVVILYPYSCEARKPEMMQTMLSSPPYNAPSFQYAELWVPERKEGQDLHTFKAEGCWSQDALTEEAFVYTEKGLQGIWKAPKLIPMHKVGTAALSVSPKVSNKLAF